MKKMKWLLLLIFTLLFISCTKNRLELEEHTIYLSNKAQRKFVTAKNLIAIENTYSDNRYDKGYDTKWTWALDDWILCSHTGGGGFYIEVTENTTGSPRRFVLKVRSTINKETIEIIQNR